MPAEQLDLRSLTKNLDRSNQDFRKAANDNSSNISRIVKDISKTFAQQRNDIRSLHETIEESIHEQEITSMKIDRLANIFGESIALQSQMVTQLRNVVIGIGSVSDSMMQMNTAIGNVNNPAEGTLLKTLSLLGGGAVIGAGTTAAIMGGGPQSEGGGQYTPEKAAALIRKVGGNEQEATVLGAISQPESSGIPTKINPKAPDYSFGLWQINLYRNLGPERRKILGLAQDGSEDKKLLDPEFNAKAALMLYRGQLGGPGGYQQWSTFQQGSHLKFIDAAKKGATGENQSATKQETTTGTVVPNKEESTKPETAAMQAALPPAVTERTKEISTENKPEQNTFAIPSGGHGLISGATPHAEKESTSAALPSGDIVALGKALKSQGFDISEHPAFGGVSNVHRGRAHYEGRAIDINLTHGKDLEADNPIAGARFDQLADQLTKLGYKVFWRDKGEGPYGLSGHRNHLHAEIIGSGTKTATGETMGATAGLPASRPQEYTQNIPTPPTRPEEYSTAQAEPIETAPMAPGGMGMDPMGVLSMLGGIGSMGGMLGMAMPLIGGLLNALGSPQEAPAMFSAQQPASKTINEAAVQSQAAMEQGFGATAGLPNIPVMIEQGVQNMGRQLFTSYNSDDDRHCLSPWAEAMSGWNPVRTSKKIIYNSNQIS